MRRGESEFAPSWGRAAPYCLMAERCILNRGNDFWQSVSLPVPFMATVVTPHSLTQSRKQRW
jgi:hypothetical protein